ncbi:hypothetical protein [Ruegeria faecimaris]|uniref:hypothetical protein n=1 Tax=Ruegeria faecimaris TaxID=686389 RepID=UPI00249021FF|nr:hypothetical protein [Ruegeria faecimaris]
MHHTTYSTPASLVAALNLDLIAVAAERRQAVGKGDGERPSPSIASDPVALVEINDWMPGALEVMIELGQKTAKRRAPAFLSRFNPNDGRYLVAMAYLGAVERIGSLKSVTLSAEAEVSGGSGVVSDGGVTSRVQDVTLVRLVHGVANRWKWDLARRSFVRSKPHVVLLPRRGNERDPITAVALLNAILIEGLSMAEILRRFGWSVQSKHRDQLTESAEQMLQRIGDKLGYSARL